MTAFNEYYVDPTVASDGGSGTVGSPWTRADGNVIQYALDTVTPRSSSVSDRINIKAGVPHTGMTAAINLTTYGTPTATAYLALQGYTTAAGDGGKGVIKAATATSYSVANSYDFLRLTDLEFDGWGILCGTNAIVMRCEVHSGTLHGIYTNGTNGVVVGCYVHGLVAGAAQSAIWTKARGVVHGCYIDTNECDYGIRLNGFGSVVTENIVDIRGVTVATPSAVHCSHAQLMMLNNTIIGSSTANCYGIYVSTSDTIGDLIANNIIANCPTFPARGIRIDHTKHPVVIANSFYDCYTDFYSTNEYPYAVTSAYENESLVSSPFTDFANADFTPVDVGEVLNPWHGIKEWAGTKPGITGYRGAVPPAAVGGGGGGGKQAILASMGFSS